MSDVGRPTKFKPEFVEQAQALCRLGATDAQLANFFNVAVSTISLWKVQRQDFSEALKVPKKEADDAVEASLYRRAMGYEADEIDIRVVDGQVVKTPIRRIYPPDTTAMIFWLKNRRPADWRDMQAREHTGPNGGPVQIAAVDLSTATPEQLRALAGLNIGDKA
jgi:hypothetical protein